MKTIAYLTKNKEDQVELWKEKPYYDYICDEWMGGTNQIGSDIFDGIFKDFLEKGECIKVEITKVEENEE